MYATSLIEGRYRDSVGCGGLREASGKEGGEVDDRATIARERMIEKRARILQRSKQLVDIDLSEGQADGNDRAHNKCVAYIAFGVSKFGGTTSCSACTGSATGTSTGASEGGGAGNGQLEAFSQFPFTLPGRKFDYSQVNRLAVMPGYRGLGAKELLLSLVSKCVYCFVLRS